MGLGTTNQSALYQRSVATYVTLFMIYIGSKTVPRINCGPIFVCFHSIYN